MAGFVEGFVMDIAEDVAGPVENMTYNLDLHHCRNKCSRNDCYDCP